MTETLLQVQNLKTQFFTYGGVVEALDSVSFDIRKGEVFGLVGESGCGKSVTALSILNLVKKPGKVVSGKIFLEGENLLEKTESEMRMIRGSKISIIFQDPSAALNPVFKIGYQVAEPLIFHREIKERDALKDAVKLLSITRIPDPESKAKNYPHEISGGMKQRAMIAMTLACKPDLLIADEPTTNLDVTIEHQILHLIRELRDEFGTSILLITHNLGVIAEMCDRVAVMYAGVIVELSDVRTIFRNPLHPYTIRLKKAIPSAKAIGKELEEIPGSVPALINPPSGCRFHPRCEQALPICKREKPKEAEIESGHFVACHLSR